MSRFNSSYEFLRKYHDEPIATYLVEGNKEVAVESYTISTDPTPNTFTSTGHNLANGERVCIIPNIDVGLIYPPATFPGGVTPLTLYYVVNVTENTFQLSSTLGGSAIDLSANATVDFTKWHFEVYLQSITLDIPEMSKCKLVMSGKNVSISGYVLPTDMIAAVEAIIAGSAAYDYGVLAISADIFFNAEITVDYTNVLTIIAKGIMAKSNNNSGNTVATIDRRMFFPNRRQNTFTSIKLHNWGFCNGFYVELYNL